MRAAAIVRATDAIDMGIPPFQGADSARSHRFTGRLQTFEAALAGMIGHGKVAHELVCG
jgi:hypothetical protein